MRFGIQLCTLGAFADPRETVRAAVAAEEAGWEGAVTPLPRRRPQMVAQQLASLSLASPIWVGGNSAAALRRARRHDGWLANSSDRERNLFSAEQIAERAEGLDDVCFIGYAAQADLGAYARAGVTWWIENVWGGPDAVHARIAAGPPR